MINNYKKYITIKNKIVMLGFGSIGQAVLPLLLRHLHISPAQIIIISKTDSGKEIVKELGLNMQVTTITKDNYIHILQNYLQEGDFLLNLSTGISSIDLINFCQSKKVLYLDACTEPWDRHYTDVSISPSLRTNYVLRESVLKLKEKSSTTAVLTHGANPGLVSHFVKQALWNMALDNFFDIQMPQNSEEWAKIAQLLNIRSIHIAERDTQITNRAKKAGEFINTWSVEALFAEAGQPAELGWGTHESHWPEDACQHTFGSSCGIYLNREGGNTKVRSWTPTWGSFHGFLITHAESLSIAHYLTLKNGENISYRPTVHYAYFPCPDALLSLHEFAGKEWQARNTGHIIVDEIIDGMDELGVLLMGNKKGAYWYGSQLSVHEARKQVSHNNATSLQVAAGVLAALIWAQKNPSRGIVEPEDIDFQYILNIALPYLGKVAGYYTDWTPLKERQTFYGKTDPDDPWQFINILV